MTIAISIASVLSLTLYVVLYLCVGAWPIVAVLGFGVLVTSAAIGSLRYDGAP
jgi:uncharacterized membrane protein